MARKPKKVDEDVQDVVPEVELEPCRICPYPADCKRAGRCRNQPKG